MCGYNRAGDDDWEDAFAVVVVVVVAAASSIHQTLGMAFFMTVPPIPNTAAKKIHEADHPNCPTTHPFKAYNCEVAINPRACVHETEMDEDDGKRTLDTILGN